MQKRVDTWLTYLYTLRWRALAIAIVVAIAWLCATWLTPYRPTVQTQFGVESTENRVTVRAEVTQVSGTKGSARILEGDQRGMTVPIEFYGMKPQLGGVVLVEDGASTDTPNSVTQPWRIPGLAILVATLVIAVIIIGGRQGAMSLLGLGVSVAVIVYYLIPTALAGDNALVASSLASFAIATIAICIAHRFRWRTLVSLLCIYLVLSAVIVLTLASGWLIDLSGVYDETSSLLQYDHRGLDMYGILLGGIIIASLGVLDDVVTTQVAAVDELRAAKPHASWKELYGRGMSVGREHLSALINTLALAYVGVALPTILVMSQQITDNTRLLMTFNYEYIAVEITRTVVSSLGIIVAIPLSTALAVVLISRKQRILAILKRLQSKLRR